MYYDVFDMDFPVRYMSFIFAIVGVVCTFFGNEYSKRDYHFGLLAFMVFVRVTLVLSLTYLFLHIIWWFYTTINWGVFCITMIVIVLCGIADYFLKPLFKSYKSGCYADIASAYPANITKLYDLRNAEIIKGEGPPPTPREVNSVMKKVKLAPRFLKYHRLECHVLLNQLQTIRSNIGSDGGCAFAELKEAEWHVKNAIEALNKEYEENEEDG